MRYEIRALHIVFALFVHDEIDLEEKKDAQSMYRDTTMYL